MNEPQNKKTFQFNEKNLYVSGGIVLSLIIAAFMVGTYIGGLIERDINQEKRIDRIESARPCP